MSTALELKMTDCEGRAEVDAPVAFGVQTVAVVTKEAEVAILEAELKAKDERIEELESLLRESEAHCSQYKEEIEWLKRGLTELHESMDGEFRNLLKGKKSGTTIVRKEPKATTKARSKRKSTVKRQMEEAPMSFYSSARKSLTTDLRTFAGRSMDETPADDFSKTAVHSSDSEWPFVRSWPKTKRAKVKLRKRHSEPPSYECFSAAPSRKFAMTKKRVSSPILVVVSKTDFAEEFEEKEQSDELTSATRMPSFLADSCVLLKESVAASPSYRCHPFHPEFTAKHWSTGRKDVNCPHKFHVSADKRTAIYCGGSGHTLVCSRGIFSECHFTARFKVEALGKGKLQLGFREKARHLCGVFVDETGKVAVVINYDEREIGRLKQLEVSDVVTVSFDAGHSTVMFSSNFSKPLTVEWTPVFSPVFAAFYSALSHGARVSIV